MWQCIGLIDHLLKHSLIALLSAPLYSGQRTEPFLHCSFCLFPAFLVEAIIPAGQIKTVPQRPTAFLASRYAAAANNGGGIAKADGLASQFFCFHSRLSLSKILA